MCVVFFDYKRRPAYPILIGANREESSIRPNTKPIIKVDGHIGYVLAGEDKGRNGKAKDIGTWLGVNHYGMVVAVTNRTDGKLHGKDKKKSRGILCHDIIKIPTLLGAVDYCVRELKKGEYGGCNFIIMDAYEGYVVHAPDHENITSVVIKSGFHAITNSDLDDMNDERVKFIHEEMKYDSELSVFKSQEICSHEKIIINDEKWGTISSSILAVGFGGTGCATKFHHSMTKPSLNSYDDLSQMTKMISAQ